MPTISKLSAVITADVKEFIAGLRSAEQESKTFIGSLKETSISAGEVAGMVGVAFSAEGLVEMVKGSLEAADASKHLADSIGVSIEAMGRLQYASKMVDVGQDQLSAAMARMSKSLYDAQSGSSEASKALADMGLSAGALMSMAPDIAFEKLADAVNGVNSPMQRLADAEAIFGRGAIALMPLLEKGSAGIKAMGDEAERFGVVLSEENAKQMQEAAEAMKQMQATAQGLGNQMAIDLAPAVKSVSENMGGLMDVFRASEAVIDSIRGSVAYLLVGVTAIPGVIGAVGEKISHALGAHDAEARFAELRGFWTGLASTGTEAFKSAGAAIDKLGTSTRGAGSASQFAAHAAGQHAGALHELASAAESSQKRIDSMMESLRQELATFGAGDLQKKISEMANGGANSGQLATAHNYADAIEQLKKMQSLNKVIADDDQRIAEMNMSDLDKLISKWNKLGLAGKDAFDRAYKDFQAQLQQDQKEQADKLQNDLKKQAQSIWEETRTPLEKAQEKIQELQKLLAGHFIDTDTFRRDLDKIGADLEKQKVKAAEPVGAAPSLELGSQAAANYVAQFTAGGYGDRTNGEILNQNREQNNKLERLISAMEKMPGDMAANFPIANF